MKNKKKESFPLRGFCVYRTIYRTEMIRFGGFKIGELVWPRLSLSRWILKIVASLLIDNRRVNKLTEDAMLLWED